MKLENGRKLFFKILFDLDEGYKENRKCAEEGRYPSLGSLESVRSRIVVVSALHYNK